MMWDIPVMVILIPITPAVVTECPHPLGCRQGPVLGPWGVFTFLQLGSSFHPLRAESVILLSLVLLRTCNGRWPACDHLSACAPTHRECLWASCVCVCGRQSKSWGSKLWGHRPDVDIVKYVFYLLPLFWP